MLFRSGAIFIDRVRESANIDIGFVVRAFAAARAIFGLDEAIVEINALDLKVAATVQIDMMQDVTMLLRRQCFWLARRLAQGEAGLDKSVATLVDAYRDGVKTLAGLTFEIAPPAQKQALEMIVGAFRSQGVPTSLAKFVAALTPLTSATDVVDISEESGLSLEAVARLYHGIGAASGLDDVRVAANSTITSDHWDRVAIGQLREDLMSEQSVLTASACDFAKANGLDGSDVKWAKAVIDGWLTRNKVAIDRTRASIHDLKMSPGGWSFAKLAMANAQLKELASGARA